MPTKRYGNAMRYTIPSFTAAALFPPSSLSKAARHIAHCADEIVLVKKRINTKKYGFNANVKEQ